MHVHANRLSLSPSDVTAFLACERLTTLSLRHARGEIDRPDTENEQAELILHAALDPSVASKARKGDFVRCLDHFELLKAR